METLFLVMLAIAVVFGILRFVLPVEGVVNKRDVFKDLAHIFVGVLFGLAMAFNELAWWLLPIALTALEVVAFVVRKKRA